MTRIAEHGDRDFTARAGLAEAIGTRPDRNRQLATLELARAVVAGRMPQVRRDNIPGLTDTHAELVRLSG